MRVSEVFTTGGNCFGGGDYHYFYGYYARYPYPADRYGYKYYYYNGYNFGGYTYFGRDRELGKL